MIYLSVIDAKKALNLFLADHNIIHPTRKRGYLLYELIELNVLPKMGIILRWPVYDAIRTSIDVSDERVILEFPTSEQEFLFMLKYL